MLPANHSAARSLLNMFGKPKENSGKFISELPSSSSTDMSSSKPLPATMRKLRELFGKSSQHQQSGPAISHPFDVSTSGGRPHLLISENFNTPQDPNVTPAERRHDRIAKLISLMKAENADMRDSFPDDLEMRIQFLEERGVDPLKDLVNFYSKRGRYANGCSVWGGWLVDLDDEDQGSDRSSLTWSNTSTESFSSFSGVWAPPSPPADKAANAKRARDAHKPHRLSDIEE
ncbi:hypothetical protein AC579_7537 [Pseudocercospora musae]|uniref:Uncharacterized protein n=1 Tax=Pseudocercospora musae TaxID=113226 RepID=A0A139II32_9PEZI|nr:hypothetical protein AC579_7537 [Pseudocercospora musae]